MLNLSRLRPAPDAPWPHRNNFDVLRIIAAVMVLVSHSGILAGGDEPGVPLTHDTIGYDGVLIFFAISGLLVTQSWSMKPAPAVFALKRALRIFPGLFVSCVLTAYVLAPFFTTLSPGKYFTSSQPAKYVIANTLMSTDYELPGVFSKNPLETVNGSLGTLPIEVKAYILLAIIGVAFRARSWLVRTAMAGLFAVVFVVSLRTGVKEVVTIVALFVVFAGASLLYLFKEKVPLRLELFLAATGLWILSYHVPEGAHILLQGFAVPYLVMYLGFRGLSGLRSLTRPGDVSYGLYIYAFPVQQAVIAATATRSAIVVIAISLPLTYALAYLSWQLIEKPALRQKSRINTWLEWRPRVKALAPQTAEPLRVLDLNAPTSRPAHQPSVELTSPAPE